MKGKVLFVVTSHSALGDTDEVTGFDLTETAVPYQIVKSAGYDVEFATPDGRSAPVDPSSRDDAVGQEFLSDPDVRDALQKPARAEALDAADYVGIYYPGGHGTMWDFPNSEHLQRLGREIYEGGGIVAAVCHGPAAFVNLRLSDGSYLVDGKRISCFTNDEEQAAEKAEIVPFLLESRLRERGGLHSKAPIFAEHVEVDGRLVTGQNPASAEALGHEFVGLLDGARTGQAAAE